MGINKIKVLIIDDSALVREVLTEILNADPMLEVIGTASDPLIARSKIKQLNPDVLTLDVEMPRMDGLTFLGNLMRLRPMPVVMVSSLTENGAEITLRALEMGAVDFVSKPKVDVAHGLEDYADEWLTKAMFGYRWLAEVDQVQMSRWLAFDMMHGGGLEQSQAAAEAFRVTCTSPSSEPTQMTSGSW